MAWDDTLMRLLGECGGTWKREIEGRNLRCSCMVMEVTLKVVADIFVGVVRLVLGNIYCLSSNLRKTCHFFLK